MTYTSAYLHTFIGCDKTPVFAQAFANSKTEWKGMMYNVAYPPCLSSLYMHESGADGGVTKSQWCPTAIGPQTGGGWWVCRDYISQKLLVVQHHGVCSLSTVTASVLQKRRRKAASVAPLTEESWGRFCVKLSAEWQFKDQFPGCAPPDTGHGRAWHGPFVRTVGLDRWKAWFPENRLDLQ